MGYAVKEIFLTLQGEGAQAGRAAVFCRFAGCNLWTGREQDRATAICRFCDTDFVGTDGTLGGRYATRRRTRRRHRRALDAARAADRYVVLTGGEPLLQVDPPLIEALHAHGFCIARRDQRHDRRRPPASTGSASAPKPAPPWRCDRGHELKLVYPQPDARARGALPISPSSASRCSRWTGRTSPRTPRAPIDYCLRHPQWRLSLQTHKSLGIR